MNSNKPETSTMMNMMKLANSMAETDYSIGKKERRKRTRNKKEAKRQRMIARRK